MYSEQELNISGRRSIAFIGEEIADASNKEASDETHYEWDAVRIFEVDPSWALKQAEKSGKRIDPFIVGIARCTKWVGARDRYRVFYARSLSQVLGIVRSQIPIFDREISEKLRLNNTPTGGLEHESRTRTME